MISPIRYRSFYLTVACLGGTLLVGCEEPVELGQVRGTVSLNGKPLNEVLVMFLPEPTAGRKGAHSECVSKENGEYELVYSLDADLSGALVGPHRVIVQDIAAENARGKRLPIRIHPSYSSAAQTPLKVEVTPGGQTLDFELRGRK